MIEFTSSSTVTFPGEVRFPIISSCIPLVVPFASEYDATTACATASSESGTRFDVWYSVAAMIVPSRYSSPCWMYRSFENVFTALARLLSRHRVAAMSRSSADCFPTDGSSHLVLHPVWLWQDAA